MNDLGTAKTYGGIGAILLLIGTFIPAVGFLVSIIGLILVFLAVKQIADITKDNDIYTNYLYHFIFSIISIVAVFAITLMAFGAAGGFSWITSLSETTDYSDFNTFWESFGTIIGGVIVALVIGWILAIFSAIYLRKSYNSIAKHTDVQLFRTAGTVYFIGAITLIILVGFLILLIARIIEIIAYFSLPDKLPSDTTKETKKSDRRCPHCDRIIPEDANACPYCSKKLT
jgi:uncharacterized membrane protein